MMVEELTERDAALQVIRTLQNLGFEAFLVGGCVRDIMLSREPKDFDVTTNARPDDVQRIFDKTIPVGASFGVIVVVQYGHQIEVATYRADGEYTDARRPDTVSYNNEAKEDIVRRDFTMNGLLLTPPMAFHVKGVEAEHIGMYDGYGYVDFVGGKEDIENKIIRAIGDPVARFTEDALRMLRAVRFAAQLGFEIEQGTLKAIVRMRENLTKISRERVAAELLKLVTAPFPVRGLAPLFHTGLARFVFTPEFVDSLKFARTLERFEEEQPFDPLLGLTMLLVDADAGVADKVLDSLKLSSDQFKVVHSALTIERFAALYGHFIKDAAAMKRLAREPGFKIALKLFEQDSRIGKSLHSAETVARILAKYLSFAPGDIRPQPFVTGQDLIDMGLKPGPEFTDILRHIETLQLNGHLKSREEALATFDNEGELSKKSE